MFYHIVIPARLRSSRLPEKVLAPIGGLPMIEHVWRAAGAASARSVCVATDDVRIATAVREFGGQCLMTRDDHASGSDRIAEVAEALELKDDAVLVNLQGDEPEMPPACLDQVAGLLRSGGDVATLYWPISEAREIQDPNAVKVVVDGQGRALYFSRAPVPHARDAKDDDRALAAGVPYRRHLGLYAYRVAALKRFTAAAPSELERAEGLEQLRFLDLGMTIRIDEAVSAIPAGVDSPEDLARVRARMEGQHD